MPFPGGHTTRRARYLYLRNLYLAREQAYRHRWWVWTPAPLPTHHRRAGRKFDIDRGPAIKQRLVNGKTYDGTFNPGWHPVLGFTDLSQAGPRRPPHVTQLVHPPPPPPPKWSHPTGAVIGFHKRGVKTRKKKPRNPFWTAFNLRVSGCNWHYFTQGYYPDADVLNRRPNMNDAANGVPPGPPGWPDPLGYEPA